MAEFYCDHGAYGNTAEFVASCSSTTLTVSSITSGTIVPGQMITGLGILPGTVINTYGTGTGGVGTYNILRSQTFTSRTCYAGKQVLNNNATPVWGVAADGDGTSSSASAVPATVDINLAGATAAAGAVISIMGAVLTCVTSGAGANQFNAGSGATLVANLVAAINRTTNTNVISPQAPNWRTFTTPMVVFARVGTPTTTLQIMTRAGSAVYNSSIVTTSGFTGGTFGPYTFSGGVGGCWGILCTNTSLAFVGSGTIGGYGVFGANGSIAGVLSGGDTLVIRGAEVPILYTNNTVTLKVPAVNTSVTNPLNVLVDDGTVWGTPNQRLILKNYQYSGNYVLTFANSDNNSVFVNLNGKMLGRDQGTFEVDSTEATIGAATLFLGPGKVSGVSIRAGVNTTGSVSNSTTITAPTGGRLLLQDAWISSGKTAPVISLGASGTSELKRVIFSNTGSGAPNLGAIGVVGSNSQSLLVQDCEFEDFTVGSQLLAAIAGSSLRAFLDNTDLGGITQRGPSFPAYAGSTGRSSILDVYASYMQSDLPNDFSIDSYCGHVEWNSSRSQPTHSALLDDGITPFSIKAVTTSVAVNMTDSNSLDIPRLLATHSDVSGQYRFKVEFVADVRVVPDSKNLVMSVSYTAVDGSKVTFDTYTPGTAVLHPESTATWTNEVGDYVTYQNGGTVNHLKYYIAAETLPGKPLKQNSKVAVRLRINKVAADAAETWFFDPKIKIEAI